MSATSLTRRWLARFLETSRNTSCSSSLLPSPSTVGDHAHSLVACESAEKRGCPSSSRQTSRNRSDSAASARLEAQPQGLIQGAKNIALQPPAMQRAPAKKRTYVSSHLRYSCGDSSMSAAATLASKCARDSAATPDGPAHRAANLPAGSGGRTAEACACSLPKSPAQNDIGISTCRLSLSLSANGNTATQLAP